MAIQIIRNPITRKRIERFKELKRAYVSFWVLLIMYILSLFCEFICNDQPLYLHFNGRSYFPILQYYPASEFIPAAGKSRPDYQRLAENPIFKNNADNYMIFPLMRYSPYESINPESIELENHVTIRFQHELLIGSVDLLHDNRIARAVQFGDFVNSTDSDVIGANINDFMPFSKDLQTAITSRFDNLASPAFSTVLSNVNGHSVQVSIPAFEPIDYPLPTVRLRLREVVAPQKEEASNRLQISINQKDEIIDANISRPAADLWHALKAQTQAQVRRKARQRYDRPVEPYFLEVKGNRYEVSFLKEDVRFPFHPTQTHFMGIDGAGRDVFARILYGLRTSMTFGLLLVTITMILGVAAGAFQGYYGGTIDLAAQRLIEIWSALPFLYIMILMGSVFGRSFLLLLFCYGIFNWIGISYYARAEFLNLRSRPFVEAAQCLGVPAYKIIFRHILPNSITPIVTFFPFSLVGAIGSLAVLDYLGFGLPAPTPSWGELLYQAQSYRWAWWLILYPSLALFIVMLLGVFVGEGVRNAFDPKRYSRLE